MTGIERLSEIEERARNRTDSSDDALSLCKALRVALEGLPCSLSIKEEPCPCWGCTATRAALAELPGAEAGGER